MVSRYISLWNRLSARVGISKNKELFDINV